MTNFNAENTAKFCLALSVEADKYAYLKMIKSELSEEQFAEVIKTLSKKGFNVSSKKLADTSAMTEEKLKEVIPSTITSAVAEELDLGDEGKEAILAAISQAQSQQAQASNNRGFGGDDLVLSAKWLGAASAALSAGGIALMRDDLSIGALAGSALGVAGGYFAADFVDGKLSGSGSFTRYLAALGVGSACGAAGNLLGSFTQEKLFSNKESDVDINITIETPGESQVLDQLAVVDYC